MDRSTDTDTATDVCVVGAGPAGLTLALLMLRSGARVTVVERSRSFDREYRGEILQPGAMSLLDDLGVLSGARAQGAYEHTRFQLVEHGRLLMDIDYGTLPGPYGFLLSLPQRHLLTELYEACARYPAFTYLDGSGVRELVRDGPAVTGVVCGTGERHRTVRARVVVAADGRYSKTRHLAGIEQRRLDVFAHDILWFRVPAGKRRDRHVRVHRTAGNPVLVYDSYPDSVQIGWTLPHNGYREIAEAGIDSLRKRIAQAVPDYADQVLAQVKELSDLTLLDVFSGYATEWAADGLVLLGDSAHTHSPIGAQGINLAVQDAVLLHPVLTAALRSGDFGKEALSTWVPDRRRDIEQVFALQARQSKAMLGGGGRVGRAVRPVVARVLARTPLFGKILRRISYGSRPVAVRSELFTEPEPLCEEAAGA
ncbi:FAD-dependent monooxygenase [Streptomyces sp. SM11]|uniref:FAD-dependent monooxygenase n=1 Tax=Streptomyces sp. SM11 TaxID=565557 RepID=UPI000CD4CBF1|nr:FAD-dependent monooxygenase [Streptomyces sp. SM11]